MSLVNQQTRVITQSTPLLLLFIVASFRTWNVTDPAIPNQVGVLALATFQFAQITQSEKVAYVSDGNPLGTDNLYLLDTNIPFLVNLLSTINLGGGGGSLRGISRPINGLLYAVNWGSSEFYVVDVTDPAVPIQLADIVIAQANPTVVAAQDNITAYVLNYDVNSPPLAHTFLQSFDVTNPTAPVAGGNIDFGVPGDINNDFKVGSIILNGTVAYVVFSQTFAVVSLAAPLAPSTIFLSSPFAAAVKAAFDFTRKILFVLDNQVGSPILRAYDMTDPTAPVAIATDIPAVNFFNDLSVRSKGAGSPIDYLYVTANGDSVTAPILLTYDTSDLENLAFVLLSTSSSIGAGGAGAAVSTLI